MKPKREYPVRFMDIIGKNHRIRAAFIEAVAEYLTSDVTARSIRLEGGDLEAQTWAQLRRLAGVTGYASAEQARVTLQELL